MPQAESTAQSLQPSSIASGPKGLVFVGLRADVKKIDAKLDNLPANVEVLRAEANVAATAVGPATPPGTETVAGGMDPFTQIRLLAEAMEDCLALTQFQFGLWCVRYRLWRVQRFVEIAN